MNTNKQNLLLLAKISAMLIGDGSLLIKYNGEGYRSYPIFFCNTNIRLVKDFSRGIKKLFKIDGKIRIVRRRNKKILYEYTVFNKNVYKFFESLGVPPGRKSSKVRVPDLFLESKVRTCLSFLLGYIKTDGGISRDRLMFHCASKKLLQDIRFIINKCFGFGEGRVIKRYIQRGFKSYQLTYKKRETSIIHKKCWGSQAVTAQIQKDCFLEHKP